MSTRSPQEQGPERGQGAEQTAEAYGAAHPPTEGSTRGSEATGVCEGHRGQRAGRQWTKSSRGGLHGRSSRERVGPRPPPRTKQQRCPQGRRRRGAGFCSFEEARSTGCAHRSDLAGEGTPPMGRRGGTVNSSASGQGLNNRRKRAAPPGACFPDVSKISPGNVPDQPAPPAHRPGPPGAPGVGLWGADSAEPRPAALHTAASTSGRTQKAQSHSPSSPRESSLHTPPSSPWELSLASISPSAEARRNS